jgi:hypothetical protein
VLSTNDGLTLLGANCDATYYGPGVGSWVLDERCIPTEPPPGDQSEVSAEYRHRALSYVSHHLSRLPVVTAARLGRTWGVFGIRDGIESGQGEGRPEWATVVGLVLYYPLVVVSIIGFLTLHRRRWLMPLLAPIVIVTFTAMVFYGQARLRAPAEPMLVVLAGVTLANWWERIEHRRSPGRRAIMVQQHRQ